MVASAAAGYRAFAFDFRGYGLSQQPPEPEKASFGDLVVDVMGVMDSLGINKVLVICLEELHLLLEFISLTLES